MPATVGRNPRAFVDVMSVIVVIVTSAATRVAHVLLPVGCGHGVELTQGHPHARRKIETGVAEPLRKDGGGYRCLAAQVLVIPHQIAGVVVEMRLVQHGNLIKHRLASMHRSLDHDDGVFEVDCVHHVQNRHQPKRYSHGAVGGEVVDGVATWSRRIR